MVKYFVSDIDSTLFDQKKGIHPKSIKSLIQLQKEGVTVVLASGRTLKAMEGVAKQLKLHQYGGYLIGSNGTSLRKATEQKLMIHHVHALKDLKRYCEKALELGLHFSIEQNGILYYTHLDPSVLYEKTHCDMRIQAFVDPLEELMEDNAKLCIHLSENEPTEGMDAFVKLFKHEVACERFHPRYMDVMPYGHSKLTGLQEILKHEQSDLSMVAAIGDGDNDIDLLTHAGFSGAVANAKESVLERVDIVVAHSAEGGVSQFAELVRAKNQSNLR